MGSFVENVNKLAANMPVDGWASLDEKVDKVAGKGLSTEDYTSLEKQKLYGIAEGATSNAGDAFLTDRGNHTGTQSIDTITESASLKILTAAERAKLDAMSPHPSKHPVSIIDGSLNPAKFIKADAVGNVGFNDVTWSDIQGKPSSYNPNAHQHTLSDLSDAILKADKTYVDTQLSTKVDTSTLTTELSKKADANTVATDAELQAAVATLQPLSQKGQANGYVPLDSGGKIPNSYLNNLSTIEVFTANSQANMLLLSNVSVGDQCIRTDLASNNLFILTQTPATELTNWKQINTSASVLSVNGQTGVVNVSKTDVGLGNVDNTADANKAVLSATKLATARTISLTSDVTGSANFDGSGNISITATVADNSHNHTLSNISDFPTAVSATELSYLDGATSNIQTQINAKQETLVSATNIKTINGSTILGSGNLVIISGDMMKSTYDSTNNGIVDRAETADKLTTPITINGTSFDGSANVNIEERLGTAIASADTTTIGTAGVGESVHITGTTTITSLGVSTTGARRTLVFDAALVLTYNATSLILPTSANITTAAGDTAEFVCENGASGYWRCVDFQRRNGYPLTLGNLSTTGNSATATSATSATTATNVNGGTVNATTGTFSGELATATQIVIGTGGDNRRGAIYSDANWGMFFRAKVDTPNMAHFVWMKGDGSELFRHNGTALTTNITGNSATATSATTATYLSNTQQTSTIIGAQKSMAMVVNDSTNNGSFVCRATGTGDGNLAGMTFWNDTYAIKLGVRSDGAFGLGGWSRSAWSWYSDSAGNMTASGNVTAYSDPRLKENFVNIENPIELVKKLNGGTFNWKHGFTHTEVKAGKKDYGILANEVEAIMPEIVTYSIDIEGEKYKTVCYEKIVPLLIEAIKEQQKQIDELKALAKGA